MTIGKSAQHLLPEYGHDWSRRDIRANRSRERGYFIGRDVTATWSRRRKGRPTNGGDVAIWLMNGTTRASAAGLGNVPTDWMVVETGDFDGDGRSDILWRNTVTGDIAMWFMNGVTLASGAGVGNVSTDWVIQGTNAN